MPLTTRLKHKACLPGRSFPFLSLNSPFSLSFPLLYPSPFVSSPSLRHCFEWSILPACITFCRRKGGAVGACGGVCCTDQLQPALAGGPHMFTGSIPPVEALHGGSNSRTGFHCNWSWSHKTVVFSTGFLIYIGITM